jgi:hypothetical protein
MRRLLILAAAALATLGLGCRNPLLPATTPVAPTSPTTSVPSVPAPAPEIPKGWTFTEDKELGFAFGTPPSKSDATIDIDALYAFDLGPTVSEVGKKSVPHLSMGILLVPSSDVRIRNGCYVEEGWSLDAKIPTKNVTAGGLTFCETSTADAAAGNRYNVKSYTTPHQGEFLIFRFVVHSVACENYDNPSKDCTAYNEQTDWKLPPQILQTVRLQAGAWAGFSVKTHTIEKKIEHAEYSVSYPEIVPEGNDTGLQTANEYAKTSATTFAAGFEDEASDITAEDAGAAGSWDLQVGGSISYLSPEVVSTIFRGSVYTGGAHPNATYDAILIDRKSAKPLTLKDLFVDTNGGLSKLVEIVRMKLGAENEISQFSDEEWITNGTAATDDNYSVYGFTNEGLLVIFAPYQVAAYAAGPFEIVIPWAELHGLLKDRFIAK